MKSKINQIPDIHIVIRLNLSQLHVTLLVTRETEGGKKEKASWNIRQLPKFISGTKLCYKPNKCRIKHVEAKAITQTNLTTSTGASAANCLWGSTATMQFRSLHPALCGLWWDFSFCSHISFGKITTRLSFKNFIRQENSERQSEVFPDT